MHRSPKEVGSKMPKFQKMSSRFVGPYWIMNKIFPLVYELHFQRGSSINLIFHVLKLKPCTQPSYTNGIGVVEPLTTPSTLTPYCVLGIRKTRNEVAPMKSELQNETTMRTCLLARKMLRYTITSYYFHFEDKLEMKGRGMLDQYQAPLDTVRLDP